MSSTSLAELAASPSGLSEQECAPSPSAKSIPTAEQSCESIGQTCPSLKMYENSQQQMFPESMLSAAASPVRTSALQARAQDLQASGPGFGESAPVLLAKHDPATSLWKTAQLCLDGDLALYSETWPRSGIAQSGIAYKLQTLAPSISGIECGSWVWPTPRASGSSNTGGSNSRRTAIRNGKYLTGSINPSLQEWLMGFPIGWTALEPSETPSSRKSRKS